MKRVLLTNPALGSLEKERKWSVHLFQSHLSIAIERWLGFKKTGKWRRKVVFRNHEHTDNFLCFSYHEELEERLWTFFKNDRKSLSLNFEKIGQKLKLFKSGDNIVLKFYHKKRVNKELQESLLKEISS